MKHLFVITIMFVSCANAQDTRQYKSCVEEFYKFIFSDKKVTVNDFSKVYCNASSDYEVSLLIKSGKLTLKGNDYLKYQKDYALQSDTMHSNILLQMRSFKKQLTQGLNYDVIYNLIEESSVYNEGTKFSTILELKLSENNTLFFEINKDTPKQIQYIWLSSGESLGDLVQKLEVIERFRRPGIINDPDGYTNIRESPEINSKIIDKIAKDEVFYYTPLSNSDWWPVYQGELGRQLGYIHKSRIRKFTEFPQKIRNEVIKLRS